MRGVAWRKRHDRQRPGNAERRIFGLHTAFRRRRIERAVEVNEFAIVDKGLKPVREAFGHE